MVKEDLDSQLGIDYAAIAQSYRISEESFHQVKEKPVSELNLRTRVRNILASGANITPPEAMTIGDILTISLTDLLSMPLGRKYSKELSDKVAEYLKPLR